MAKPIKFKEQNRDWQRPQSMSDDECGPLPAFVDDNQSISCWSLGWKERVKLLFTGRIWLGILAGGVQPPVWIMVNRPFTEPAEQAVVLPRDNEVLRDLLELVGEPVPLEVVEIWTDEQYDRAGAWAGAVHLEASDNELEVPDKPAFLAVSWNPAIPPRKGGAS